jgi:hypothetical protein
MTLRSYKTYCVTHAAPLVPESFIDFTIGLGSYLPVSGASIAQLDTYWHERRPVAYGAAGSYVLARAMQQAGDAGHLVGICSHRKIVVRDPIGRQSRLIAPMREAEAAELLALSGDACSPREPHEFLLHQPLPLGNIVAHYAHNHRVIDLLDYLSIAVEIGELAPGDVATFVTQQGLLTGGCELGVYPRLWLVETLSRLERVSRLFLERHADRISRYDNYNIRTLAFLSERLGSFFLIQELRRRYPRGVPGEIFGFICCVVEPGGSYSPAEAE